MRIGSLIAKNVQYSWGEHGPASASFEVAVKNAYLEPPPGLREGAWIELTDGGETVWDGEIASIKPSVDADGHKLSVECGGMLSIAQKRGDLTKTWVHRGTEGWIRDPANAEIGSFTTDNGVLEMRVTKGTTEDFSAGSVSSAFGAVFVLDDELTDAEISYVSYDLNWDVTAESGFDWTWRVRTYQTLLGAGTNLDIQTGTSAASTPGALAPPSGTKALRVLLYCASGAHTVAAEKFVTFTNLSIYSSGRTSKVRLDEAMVEIATRPGLAVAFSSKPIGPPMDDLSVGSATSRTNPASALEELAARHSQPFDWRFDLGRKFIVKPLLWTPDNDARVVMLGESFPGLKSWDVAEYDEDNPEYACVIFGNKDSAAYPEAWPRRMYRPGTPPNENVRVETVDLSGSILTDNDARAVGDYITATKPPSIPQDYVFRVHPERARSGLWPNDNDNLATRYTYQDISENRAVGTLVGAPQWGGTNSPADPSCLSINGSTQYVDFGDLSQLDLGVGARSVSTWVKFNSVGTTRYLVNKSLGGPSYHGWSCNLLSGKLQAAVYEDYATGKYRAGAGGTSLVSDVWYHAVFVYAGSSGNWTIYLNGVAETMTPDGTAGAWNVDNATAAALGARTATGTGFLDGSLGETIIYPRALTAAEAAQLYAAGPALYDRSLARGNVVVEGKLMTRAGSEVEAKHLAPIDWWVQNPSVGKGRPLLITGTSRSVGSRENALTIGSDWMYEEIGVRQADLLALEATPDPEETEPEPEPEPDENPDPWKNWRG